VNCSAPTYTPDAAWVPQQARNTRMWCAKQGIEAGFGPQRMIYADCTASGRALAQVEDFIRDQVLPVYANSHTEASWCGAAMTQLRAAARCTVDPATARFRLSDPAPADTRENARKVPFLSQSRLRRESVL